MVYAGGIDVSKPLIGTDEATLDDKYRITLTTKKVQRIGENFVMAYTADCIVMYPQSVWMALVEEALSLPTMHPARQEFTRCLMSTATDGINFDQQNRFVLPADLREAAKLDKGDKVKIAGCCDRIEIWKALPWSRVQGNTLDSGRRSFLAGAYQDISNELIRSRHTKEREEQAKERGQ
ncbi:MAG: hypothetical protein HZC36_12460 [Armatimonadetes bacterium]|nr:hypothetical protein [Armatimonadota bacterium]